MNLIKIGQIVSASITKGGYWVNSYKGEVVGFTKSGNIKVKSWRGVKIHSPSNVYCIE